MEHAFLLKERALYSLLTPEKQLDMMKAKVAKTETIDECCFPDFFLGPFLAAKFNIDDAKKLLHHLKDIIVEFNGSKDNVYNKFHLLTMEYTPLTDKLGGIPQKTHFFQELTNRILSYLSSDNNDDSPSTSSSIELSNVISEKEVSALQYLAGYSFYKCFLKIIKNKAFHTS